jgi:hypothetical protein
MHQWIKRFWWFGAYYIGVAAVIAIQQRLKIQITQDTIILVAVLLVPFVFSRLTKIEAGGMKFELRELRNEVIETKQQIRQEVAQVREGYQALSDRLTSLASSAADFLKPQDLMSSDEKMRALRKRLKLSDELSDEEIAQGLESGDPDYRIVAYAELQVRPQRQLLRALLDCYSREKELALRSHETRPLWQLLVATDTWLGSFQRGSPPGDIEELRKVLADMLEFLKNNPTIDPGRQCRTRLELILRTVQS